ncbi:MAG: DHH family phosphoesterase [Eubacteriales bacterium]|nr:DHH family phosphoesterase [Eubacteriales bacterium]
MNPKKFFKNNLFSFVISTAFMAALCAVAFVFNTKAGMFSSVLLACYLVYVFVYVYFGSGDAKNLMAGKSLASHTFDFISEMSLPVLLCDSSGAVSWYNGALEELYSESKIKIGESCKNIGDGVVSVQRFTELKEQEKKNYTIRHGEKYYRIHPYQIETMRKSFYLVVWYDVTEYEKLYAEHLNSNVLVAYAVVDNISEISQGLQDKYRQISARIANVLTEWVSSMKGIIKEYERDKYIIFFEERYINRQVDAKFDILDKVYEISDTDENLPLTVSVGVARLDGTLTEKEEAAKISLQLALQRGGAQAIVKTKTDTDFYGGRTKTIQKRTKIKSRMVAAQLVSLMNKASNVLIMGHVNPDFDAIASGIGVARLAMYLGKDVKIITDFSNPSFNICSSMLSMIKDYDNTFVDKIYGQELLTPNTLLVITDVSNERIFESPDIYRKAEHIAIIDHHRQTQEFDREHEISYIEPTASSASELISEMLELVLPPNTLYKEEAELLLAGILLDTQNFNRNVGIRTFSAAVYLRSEGANTGKAQSVFKYQLGEFKKLAEFERNILIFRKIFAITQYDLDNTPENRVIAAQAAERMLQIEGIKASFTLSLTDDAIHISARSDGSVNVSLILEKLKGGGHFDSAGAKLTGISMKQAMIMLREAIIEYCETE